MVLLGLALRLGAVGAWMALPWGHNPWGQLEVTALGQRCLNYLILRKKIALAGARVGAT